MDKVNTDNKKCNFEIIPGKADIKYDDTTDINKITNGVGISGCNDDFWFKILREYKLAKGFF